MRDDRDRHLGGDEGEDQRERARELAAVRLGVGRGMRRVGVGHHFTIRRKRAPDAAERARLVSS